MGSQTLPEGMSWEDCRTCGGLVIVSPTGSVNGGTVTCCFECMKKAVREAERKCDIMRLGVREIGVLISEFAEHDPTYTIQRATKIVVELDPPVEKPTWLDAPVTKY
jgi:hypothetical protein